MGGLEDENLETNLDEESTDTKKWMKETMRDLKQRSDEVSDLERSISSMQCDMGEVKENLNKVTSSLVKMTEGNEVRDRKLDDLIKSLSAGLAERERKAEERFDNMERCFGAKMDEKFSDFEKESARLKEVRGVLDTIALVLPKVDGVPLQRA